MNSTKKNEKHRYFGGKGWKKPKLFVSVELEGIQIMYRI